MQLNTDMFSDLYTMHDLEYNNTISNLGGIPITTSDDVNIWDEYKSDHVERMKQSLASVLTEDNSFIPTKNDYVIYAAIDLMNLVYTREFSSNSTTSRTVCSIIIITPNLFVVELCWWASTPSACFKQGV